MATLRISAPLLIAAGAVWPPVCGLIVALRFAIRKAQKAPLGPDDCFTLPALLFLTAMGAAAIAGAALHGMGYPTPPVPPDMTLTATSREQTVTRIIYWASNWMNVAALGCIKISALFFYRRIFGMSGKSIIDKTLSIMVGIVVAWTISFFCAIFFACDHHFDYLWTNLENQAKCSDTVVAQTVFAATDVVTDLFLLIFPIPLIWRLHMPARFKIPVTLIFLIGSLSIAFSIVRLVILVQSLNVEFAAGIDEDYLSTNATYFQLLETGFGLCAICLPTLSGGMKLGVVQTLFQNFGSIASSVAKSVRPRPSIVPSQVGSQKNPTGAQPTTHQEQAMHQYHESNATPNAEHGAVVEMDELEADHILR